MTVSRNIVKTRKWFVASARRKRRRRRGQGQGHCILPQIPVFPANFPSEGSTNSRGTQNCKASIATHLCGRVPAAETELHRKLLHTVRDASSSLQLFLFAFLDNRTIAPDHEQERDRLHVHTACIPHLEDPTWPTLH